MEQTFYPIVVAKKTNDAYRYIGNDEYENLRTLKKGVIEPELAQQTFLVDLDASEMINKYPLVGQMISQLGLKISK